MEIAVDALLAICCDNWLLAVHYPDLGGPTFVWCLSSDCNCRCCRIRCLSDLLCPDLLRAREGQPYSDTRASVDERLPSPNLKEEEELPRTEPAGKWVEQQLHEEDYHCSNGMVAAAVGRRWWRWTEFIVIVLLPDRINQSDITGSGMNLATMASFD
ncbi:hypothetical protein ACLOJK_027160 [Asimina triloba]